MGKRIKTQRRGKGKHRFTAPSHRFKTDAKYRRGSYVGVVVDLKKDPSKYGILMSIEWEDGKKNQYLAPEGICVGDEITQETVEIENGNILKIKDIPEGIPFFNVERTPGDGGKLVRSSGSSATVVAKQNGKAMVKLPSKRVVPLNGDCRATIGIVSGGERTDKPLIKAGNNYYKMRARGHLYPVVRGVAMNPVAHPHGGSQHHSGKATTVKRGTPPGRNVGHIAARRTGRKKRK
ncbi:MAG: 50S ribosomal protein L2 [Candidatus Diapherotrites archaeon]|nr:50S ribosomal protein L2 [Candidatus Diapherotrites archaeon]